MRESGVLSFAEKVDVIDNSLAADRTELVRFVQVVHQAVPPRAVDALGGIPAASKTPTTPSYSSVSGVGTGVPSATIRLQNLSSEPDERRQVGFPRFDTFRVHVVIGGRADIFVAQPQQQMAELVDMDFPVRVGWCAALMP